jgi:hypothetical protein
MIKKNKNKNKNKKTTSNVIMCQSAKDSCPRRSIGIEEIKKISIYPRRPSERVDDPSKIT